jgi:hypothetical protein
MRHKKSQIALFMLLGISLLVLFVLTFCGMQNITKSELDRKGNFIKSDISLREPTKTAIDNCLSQTSINSILNAALQGGFVTPQKHFSNLVRYEHLVIPYYVNCGANIVPDMYSMQLNLEEVIYEDFRICVETALVPVLEKRGMNLTIADTGRVQVSLEDKGVTVTLDAPIDISGAKFQISESRFKSRIDIPFRHLYNSTLAFINISLSQDSIDDMSDQFGYNLTPYDCMNITQGRPVNVFVLPIGSNYDIIQIIDYSIVLNESPPRTFQFAMHDMNFANNTACIIVNDSDRDSVPDAYDDYPDTPTFFVDNMGADCSQKECAGKCIYIQSRPVCVPYEEELVELPVLPVIPELNDSSLIVDYMDCNYRPPQSSNPQKGRWCNALDGPMRPEWDGDLAIYGDTEPDWHDECLRGAIQVGSNCSGVEGERCSYGCCSSPTIELYDYAIHRRDLKWKIENSSDDCKHWFYSRNLTVFPDYAEPGCSGITDPDGPLSMLSYSSASWGVENLSIQGDCGSLPYSHEVFDDEFIYNDTYVFGPSEDKNGAWDCWYARKWRSLYYYEEPVKSYDNITNETVFNGTPFRDLRSIARALVDDLPGIIALCQARGGIWHVKKDFIGCADIGIDICNFPQITSFQESCTASESNFGCDDQNIYCSANISGIMSNLNESSGVTSILNGFMDSIPGFTDLCTMNSGTWEVTDGIVGCTGLHLNLCNLPGMDSIDEMCTKNDYIFVCTNSDVYCAKAP